MPSGSQTYIHTHIHAYINTYLHRPKAEKKTRHPSIFVLVFDYVWVGFGFGIFFWFVWTIDNWRLGLGFGLLVHKHAYMHTYIHRP